MTAKWIPGPRYLCRRKLALELVRRVNPASALEIGFGSGDMLRSLAARGYAVTGIDQSATARAAAQGQPFKVDDRSDEALAADGARFGLVMAFEVLEHIEDDLGALRRWRSLVTDGGHLLLSVPAHMSKWGGNDEYAGHIRRYEKAELLRKLSEAGLEPVKIWSYGYPVINLVKYAKDFLVGRRVNREASKLERTGESWKGLSLNLAGLGRFIFNDLVFYPAYLLQDLFLDRDLGTGYLALARRK